MKDQIAFELSFPETLKGFSGLPPLHLIVGRRADGLVAAHCLDFDTWAFSDRPEFHEAASEAIKDLIELAFADYFRRFSTNELASLYRNEADDDEWKEFRKVANLGRVGLLETTMRHWMDGPEEERESEPVVKVWDFSHFSEAETRELEHWLGELRTADESRRNEILAAMLRSLTQALRLVAA